MPDKRESRISAAVTEREKATVRDLALKIGTDESGLIRKALAIAVPLLLHVDYLDRVRLQDSKYFKPLE